MKQDIKILFMDVDGTLTDGKIYIGKDGEVMKAFDVKDGYAIHEMLTNYNIEPIIVTGRESLIVQRRADEIGVQRLYQGINNKVTKINELIEEFQNDKKVILNLTNIAYIGDDLNDLPAIKKVKEEGGLTGCPADAVKKVRDTVDYICESAGGNGAVREFIEWILE